MQHFPSDDRISNVYENGKLPLSVELTCEPRHEKTCLRGFRPGKTQTGMLSFRS